MSAPGDLTERRRARRLEQLALLALIVLLAVHAVVRGFNRDEFEHVHSAWYLAQGCLPYQEFFQHHHPLLWLLIVPVLRLLGDGPDVLVAVRLLMLGFALGIVVLAWSIAHEVGVRPPGCRLAALLLVSQIIFFEKSIEIRPDVPALCIGLVGVACWLNGVRRGRWWMLVAAGLSLGVSFLVIQKIALVVLGAAIVILAGWRGSGITWRHLAVAAASAVVPVAAFGGWVVVHGLWQAYFVSNWLANLGAARAYGLEDLDRSLSHNPVFWVAAGAALWRWGIRRRGRGWFRRVLWLGVVLFALHYLDRRPNPQDLLWPQTLLAVPAGRWLACVLRRGRTARAWKVLTVPLAVVATLFAGLQLRGRTNVEQRARIAFVLERAAPGEAVYDGVPSFNVFRPDVDFYWFALAPGSIADTHAALTGGRNPAPRLVEALVRVRPAVAGPYLVDWSDPRLLPLYRPAAMEELHELIERRPPAAGRALQRGACWAGPPQWLER